jgi:23S rRNA pseudouridine2605 synthase
MAQERLQKILAGAGVSSRRGAETLIASGRVTVNGTVARLGQSADPDHDVIEVAGRRLEVSGPHRYLALNKPAGFVSSLRSTHGEPTVVELVPQGPRVYPVGRLDKETSGLLLLTDDGDWANLVTHPRYGVQKQYDVLVRGRPTHHALESLRNGVVLPDGAVTAPALVAEIGDDKGNARLSITVVEGKKRQIRLMARAVGYPVVALRRIRIGNIRLGSLSEGQWRELRREEVEGIRELAGHNAGTESTNSSSSRQH